MHCSCVYASYTLHARPHKTSQSTESLPGAKYSECEGQQYLLDFYIEFGPFLERREPSLWSCSSTLTHAMPRPSSNSGSGYSAYTRIRIYAGTIKRLKRMARNGSICLILLVYFCCVLCFHFFFSVGFSFCSSMATTTTVNERTGISPRRSGGTQRNNNDDVDKSRLFMCMRAPVCVCSAVHTVGCSF